MSFMEKQITRKQNWLRVETSAGITFVDCAGLSLFVRNSHQEAQPLTEQEMEDTVEKIQPYVEGTPQEWENIKGYGARLSAPGYLDCTEWDVFDTAEEAQKYLDETYPDEEEESL